MLHSPSSNRKLSRKERRRIRQENGETNNITTTVKNFSLKRIQPLTNNQRTTFEAFTEGKNLILTGTAGTGKSFLSTYLGLNEVVEKEEQSKLVIVRSVVPTRDMGFLPGNNREKSQVYEAPYYSIFSELFERGDAYDYLKNRGVVEFITTSFVRGITINDSVILVDEFQNMTASELHTIFTRIGKNCRVIFAGDIKQTDLNKYKELTGFADFIKILSNMKSFELVDFNRDDIVRSSIVKDYIITREYLEDKGAVQPIVF